MQLTHPIELTAPDISAYRRGNRGVDYVHTFDSSVGGPHVVVSAVVHGNELCGAIVLDELLRTEMRPIRGKLTLLFANVDAFLRFDPDAPSQSRFVDEDFNRLWDASVLDSARTSVELARARLLRPIIDEADYLLDIHSMQRCDTPLMMCGCLRKGRELARVLGVPRHIVADAGHVAGKRMRDYGPFADEASPKNALLVECGQHWLKKSADVAKEVTLRFLNHYEMVAPQYIHEHLLESTVGKPEVIEVTAPVTIKTHEFRLVSDFVGMEVIEKKGTVVGWDGDEAVQTPYDDCVLIMPSQRFRKGDSALRFGRYVE